MMIHEKNIISENEINKVFQFWFDNQSRHKIQDDFRYNAIVLNLMEIMDKLDIEYKFNSDMYEDSLILSVEELDESKGLTHYDRHHHFHKNNWTYVLYLNDNFDGGELEFKDGRRIKPERGDMIGFDDKEAHRVIRPYNFKPYTFIYNGIEKEINRRFSLVGFMKHNIFNVDTSRTKLF